MDLPDKPRMCTLSRGAEGYGFNLHGEKGQHGQYIRAVDDDSPAHRAGLKSGDRVIEVDGTNIERETHTQVVARIKAGGGTTTLLVVDKELDSYFRKNGITIKASMVEGGSESPRINGDHLEVESEVHMNGDAEGMGNGEVIEASLEAREESAPERQEEEHQYSEIERREEREDEDVVDEQFASVLADVEIGDEERRDVEEDEVVMAEPVAMEESIPDMAPPIDRDDEPDVNIPEAEPEPLLEAASVPVVESAPPAAEPEPVREPTPEPEREPTPEPVREPTPEPVREPTPEPVREPTPEPVREPTPEPVREPTPEPVRQPTPELKPVKAPTRADSVPPSRPVAPPTSRQASLNVDPKSGLDLSTMDKARILAAGRKKKKQASAKNWEDKYAAFNNL